MEERRIHQSLADQKDFAGLYQQYYTIILGFVKSFVKSADIAEDITQDLFLRLIEKKFDVNQIEHIKTYLFTSAKNSALNYLKKASRNIQTKEILLVHYFNQQGSLEDDLADLEYQAYLKKYLERLTAQNQAVFKLCRQEGKTYEEAAKLLGISQSAVKKHMIKSMKSLKALLKKDFNLIFAMVTSIF